MQSWPEMLSIFSLLENGVNVVVQVCKKYNTFYCILCLLRALPENISFVSLLVIKITFWRTNDEVKSGLVFALLYESRHRKCLRYSNKPWWTPDVHLMTLRKNIRSSLRLSFLWYAFNLHSCFSHRYLLHVKVCCNTLVEITCTGWNPSIEMWDWYHNRNSPCQF